MPDTHGLSGRELLKGHATENDFLLLVDPDCEVALTSADVAAVCDRRAGVGADGLVRVVRTAALPGAELCHIANPLGPKQPHRISAWAAGLYSVHGGVDLEGGSSVAALAVDATTVTCHGRRHLSQSVATLG